MPRRTEEAEAFITGVYMAVQEIPYGRVTSYGHIARLIGKRIAHLWAPQNIVLTNTDSLARRLQQHKIPVGQALKHLPAAVTEQSHGNTFHSGNVPWQRVVAADGTIPRRDDPSGAQRHANVLQGEGVEVMTKSDGRLCVNLGGSYGWFPTVLPSEEEMYGDFYEHGEEGEET